MDVLYKFIMVDPGKKFSLAAFESMDIEGKDKAVLASIKMELEQQILDNINQYKGWKGVEKLISSLNANGHQFKQSHKDKEILSYFEETNDATREFWIHAIRQGDLVMANTIYFEKLDITRQRQRAEMSDHDRRQAKQIDEFYDQGLELVNQDDKDATLTDKEYLHLVLYLLDTGVNNGGFATYITNTEGSQLENAVKYLARVGANDIAAICKEVLELFPGGFRSGLTDEVWNTLDEQREKLDELEARYFDTKDNLALLVMQHLNKV